MSTLVIKSGEIVLRKPTAGQRNKAAVVADTKEGFKYSVFLTELLPLCIAQHPFGITPIRQALDNLEFDEYDKIVEALQKLLDNGDAEKKLKEPSEQNTTSKPEVMSSQ